MNIFRDLILKFLAKLQFKYSKIICYIKICKKKKKRNQFKRKSKVEKRFKELFESELLKYKE